MARMPRLSDLQYVLLATAANRTGGSLLPPSKSVRAEQVNIDKSIASLIRRGFAEEVETSEPGGVWRAQGDQRMRAIITAAGRTAIGTDVPADAPVPTPPATVVEPIAPVPLTKIGLVLALLRRDDGATLAELVEATGWLPHTTRAALTGLRKKGHALAKSQRNDATCYRIVEVA
jgi:hypothetical protein